MERKSVHGATGNDGDGNAVCKIQAYNPLCDLWPDTSPQSLTATEDDWK